MHIRYDASDARFAGVNYCCQTIKPLTVIVRTWVAFPSFWIETRAGRVLDSHMTNQLFFSFPLLSKRTCRTFDVHWKWRNLVLLGHSVTLIMFHGFNAWAFLKPFKKGRITQSKHNDHTTDQRHVSTKHDHHQTGHMKEKTKRIRSCTGCEIPMPYICYYTQYINIARVDIFGIKAVKIKHV
jgi:hypothetical protein